MSTNLLFAARNEPAEDYIRVRSLMPEAPEKDADTSTKLG
jgi:hypothetical protein